MFIDTHCHLNFQNYDNDYLSVINNAQKSKVMKIIVPGVDLSTSFKAVELTQQNHQIIYASIGFHPYESEHDPHISDLENIIKHHQKSVIAIGECGLDYHLFKEEIAQGKKDHQKKLFSDHLQLANKYNLPVIMHVRDAWDDFFDVIDSMEKIPFGVIHCFSGGLRHINLAQQRKLYIGLDGNITYSHQLQSIIPQIPPEMMLLETDSPNLSPIPYRGTRNEPKHIPLIAQQIALLSNIQLAIIEQITTQNAVDLFHFSGISVSLY
jgi:TatD DNase family protein